MARFRDPVDALAAFSRGIMMLCCILHGIPAFSEPATGGPASYATDSQPVPAGLDIQDGLVTLSARDDSLNEILKALGRHFGFEVLSHIPTDKTITLEIERETLRETVEQLTSSENTVMELSDGGKTLKRLILLQNRGQTPPQTATQPPPEPVKAEIPRPTQSETAPEPPDGHDDQQEPPPSPEPDPSTETH